MRDTSRVLFNRASYYNVEQTFELCYHTEIRLDNNNIGIVVSWYQDLLSRASLSRPCRRQMPKLDIPNLLRAVPKRRRQALN